VLLICAAFVYAQEPNPPVPIAPGPGGPAEISRLPAVDPPALFSGPTSLEDLIAYARAHNPEILAAKYRAQSLGARVPQVASLPDPTLMTTAFLEENQTAAGPQQVAVSLSQKFPWLGKRAMRSQVAYYDSMAAYARVASTELKVVEQIKRAYFDLYFVQRAFEENHHLEKPLEDVIDVAKHNYETSVGKTGLQSVFQAQVELAKLKTDLVKLEEAKHQAQARLSGALHLPPQKHLEAVATIDRGRLAQELETLMGLADSFQPEYRAYRHELARDRSAVELAQRAYWPDVTMSLAWYQMGDRGLSPVANGEDAFSVAAGVNLPIYRSRLDAAVREAENKLSATTRRYDAVRDVFQTEIQTLAAQFREHHRTLAILEVEIVPRAEETLKLTMEAYRAGRTDFQQLIDVYRTLQRYRIDLHRRAALSEQALASLERAVGCAVTSHDPSRSE